MKLKVTTIYEGMTLDILKEFIKVMPEADAETVPKLLRGKTVKFSTLDGELSDGTVFFTGNTEIKVIG